MRFAIALLCVLALTGSAGAETCRGTQMPPMDKRLPPTVYYEIRVLPRTKIEKYCGAPNHPSPAACSFQSPTKKHPDRWLILRRDELPISDVACVTAYEKSHLPPNNWIDEPYEAAVHPPRD